VSSFLETDFKTAGGIHLKKARMKVMTVSLVAQVMSSTVAASLSTLVAKGEG
jgi:hypothetical protein